MGWRFSGIFRQIVWYHFFDFAEAGVGAFSVFSFSDELDEPADSEPEAELLDTDNDVAEDDLLKSVKICHFSFLDFVFVYNFKTHAHESTQSSADVKFLKIKDDITIFSRDWYWILVNNVFKKKLWHIIV